MSMCVSMPWGSRRPGSNDACFGNRGKHYLNAECGEKQRRGRGKREGKKWEERMRAQRIRWRKWLLLIMCAAGEQHAGKRTTAMHVCVWVCVDKCTGIVALSFMRERTEELVKNFLMFSQRSVTNTHVCLSFKTKLLFLFTWFNSIKYIWCSDFYGL